MFVCNAWELMLKALLIKRNGEKSIYYIDKKIKNKSNKQNRTLSLEDCLKKFSK